MAAARTDALERARLSLLGLSIGDAFGETMFGEPGESARRSAKRLISMRRPWRWTDDTAMALSIVEVLGRHDGIDGDALAAAFARRWAAEPHRGYGQGAFSLLTQINCGMAWRTAAGALFNGKGCSAMAQRCARRRSARTSPATSTAWRPRR